VISRILVLIVAYRDR